MNACRLIKSLFPLFSSAVTSTATMLLGILILLAILNYQIAFVSYPIYNGMTFVGFSYVGAHLNESSVSADSPIGPSTWILEYEVVPLPADLTFCNGLWSCTQKPCEIHQVPKVSVVASSMVEKPTTNSSECLPSYETGLEILQYFPSYAGTKKSIWFCALAVCLVPLHYLVVVFWNLFHSRVIRANCQQVSIDKNDWEKETNTSSSPCHKGMAVILLITISLSFLLFKMAPLVLAYRVQTLLSEMDQILADPLPDFTNGYQNAIIIGSCIIQIGETICSLISLLIQMNFKGIFDKTNVFLSVKPTPPVQPTPRYSALIDHK